MIHFFHRSHAKKPESGLFSDWIGNNTDDLRYSDWPKRRHPLVVVDFSLHFCLRINEQNTHASSLWNFCRLSFLEFEEYLNRNFIHWNIFNCSQKFTDHLNAIWYRLQVTEVTNGFTFQIINSWMESWPWLNKGTVRYGSISSQKKHWNFFFRKRHLNVLKNFPFPKIHFERDRHYSCQSLIPVW